MNSREKGHIAALLRRRAWLEALVKKYPDRSDISFVHQELKALTWAIPILGADDALTVGAARERQQQERRKRKHDEREASRESGVALGGTRA